jgi:starch synthase
MNILMVASEAAPYLRTGDVANVVTGLSLELHKQGHDVRIVIPRYRNLVLDPRLHTITSIIDQFDVPLGAYKRRASVSRINCEPPIYLIGNEFFFGRDDPYGYLDDYERFIFFTFSLEPYLRCSSNLNFHQNSGDLKLFMVMIG